MKLETSKNTSSSYRPHLLQTIVSIRECYSWNPASDEGQEIWSNSLNMLILAIALIRLYCRLMANCLLLLLHGFSCNVECWANANQKKCSKHSVGNVESIGYLGQLLWIWYLATWKSNIAFETQDHRDIQRLKVGSKLSLSWLVKNINIVYIYTLNVSAFHNRLRLENFLGKALKVQTRHLGSQKAARMPQ